VLPAARTRDEAHLYMDLNPCECGEVDVTWQSSLTDQNGVPARRYSGGCPGCGQQREFLFGLPQRPLVPGPEEIVLFGGPECSQLLDAGEWLLVADLCARAGSVRPDDPEGHRAEARESMAIAAAAVQEVLKFVPAGADEVPDTGFWTERGRAVRHQEPGRFRRRPLAIVRDTYRDALDRM
jgi:hypothetical protein